MLIQNTWIGLDPDGSTPFPNQDGITIFRSANVKIGGPLANQRNVIAESGALGDRMAFDFGGFGIRLEDTAAVEIEGNFIGTNAAGTEARRNRAAGIYVRGNDSFDVSIGGPGPGDGNVISGSGDPASPPFVPTYDEIAFGAGIFLGEKVDPANWLIQGNKIGTNAAGTAPIANVSDNIAIDTTDSQVLIGGTSPGEGNLIAHSLFGGGIAYPASITRVNRTAILGNEIYDNHGGSFLCSPHTMSAGLGIGVFCASLPVPNDDTPPYDTDLFQNYPVLETASSDGETTRVGGYLHSQASRTFRLEFFSNTACDPSGFGEGENFLGGFDQDTGPQGTLAFDALFPTGIPGGHTVVTATATLPSVPLTSEFSACIPVPEPGRAALLACAAGVLACLRLARACSERRKASSSAAR